MEQVRKGWETLKCGQLHSERDGKVINEEQLYSERDGKLINEEQLRSEREIYKLGTTAFGTGWETEKRGTITHGTLKHVGAITREAAATRYCSPSLTFLHFTFQRQLFAVVCPPR